MSEINIEVDSELEDLIPGFLENRQTDIQDLKRLVSEKNLSEIKKIAHRVKGTAGGYGFDFVTEIAREIEDAALDSNFSLIDQKIIELESGLSSVRITFVSS